MMIKMLFILLMLTYKYYNQLLFNIKKIIFIKYKNKDYYF